MEDLSRAYAFEAIDLLKLDCEGSEFSFLGNTSMLSKVRIIVGEYHGRERFHKLVAERFSDWHLTILREGNLGLFRLERKI